MPRRPMAIAQIISGATTEIGPSGPQRRLYAVNLETPEVALEELRKRLKPAETAIWLGTRTLSMGPPKSVRSEEPHNFCW